MVRDRLPDLQKRIEDEKHAEKYIFGNQNSNPGSHVNSLSQFDEIKKCLDSMSSRVQELKKKHADILSNPVNDNKSNNELELLNQQIKKLATESKNRLKIVDEQINNDKYSESATAKRIAKSQFQSLSTYFKEIMTNYNDIQLDYKEKCKIRIKRKLEISGQNFNNDQVEEMIESDNPAVFTQNIIADSLAARQMLNDVTARHNELMEMESNIRDIHEIFRELANMVEQQGHVVDNIEYNINNASESIKIAEPSLKKAKESQISLRKKKIILAVIGVIVIIVLILIIYFSIPKK